MYSLDVTPERLRNARPDCISDIGQLAAGQVVISFSTYSDLRGIVNTHLSELAVVRGAPYRIVDDEIIDRGIGLGKHMRVEKLPAFTQDKPTYEDPTWLRVHNLGIAGVDSFSPPAGLGRGLLAVREEPFQVDENLEVGPGLYVNGSNDYHMLFKGQFMAVALDSNPRLAGQLGSH